MAGYDDAPLAPAGATPPPAVNLGGGVTSAQPAPAQPVIPTVTVRPPTAPLKLPPEMLTKKAVGLGYAPAAAAGITQNIMRESNGDPTNVTGDSGTSRGLFQHHAERKAELEAYAKAQGKDPSDPDVQFQFADQEMRTKYPKLRALLADPKTTTEQAESAFRTIFERPKVGGGYDSSPVTATDKFRFSDYALKQYANKPDTDVVWMKPSDYLDLTPDLGGDAKGQKAAKELQASLAKGEPIEAIPTLDIASGPNGSKVIDQDGRHRALAAQQAGLDLMPVAVKRERNPVEESGQAMFGMAGSPQKPITELEGMTGKLLPFDFQPYQAPGKAGQAAAPAQADGMLLSGVKGAAAGVDKALLGGVQLAGEGLKYLGTPTEGIPGDVGISGALSRAGDWLSGGAARASGILDANLAPDRAANPISTEAGELLGSSVAPAGVMGKMAGGAMKLGAVAGGVSGLLDPVADPGSNFTLKKLAQTSLGAGAGAVVGKAGELAARAAAPAISTVANWIRGVKGPNVTESAAVQTILRRMSQDVKGGHPSAQDMLDLLTATPDKPLTITDVGGPNVKALMGQIARQPGEAQAILKKFHTARDVDAGLRVDRDINENIGAGSTFSIAKTLEDARSRMAAPLYNEAMDANQQMESPLLDKIIRTPAGQSAMRQAVAKMQNDMTLVAKPDPELTQLAKEVADLGLMNPHGSGVGVGRGLKLRTWDYVKRSLDDQIGVAQRKGERDEARILTGLKKTMVSEMDRLDVTGIAGPNSTKAEGGAYTRARAVYSGHSGSLDALESGRGFMQKSPEEITAELADMTPGDREFYKVGAAEKLRLRVGDTSVGGDEAKKAITNRNMRDRLRAVVGGDENLAKFEKAINAESMMFDTDVQAFKNSLTAQRVAEDRAPENEAAGKAFHAATQFMSGNHVGGAINAVRAWNALRGAPNPEIGAGIARIFANPATQPGAGFRLLQEFARQAPATAMQMNTISRPMSALLGSGAQQGTQPMIPQ